jgi:CHAD domain-containing protein
MAHASKMQGAEPSDAVSIYAFLSGSLKARWKRYRKKLKQCQRRFSEGAVHNSRIETRRLLSLIELLAAFLPSKDLNKARRILKHHLDAFNDLRDTHVQLIFVGGMLRTFPAMRTFHAALVKHESRCARRTAKDVKQIKTTRLARLVRSLLSELRKKDRASGSAGRAVGLERATRSIHRAYAGVTLRLRRIDPADTATIHRTRIAFKRFRYMVEALASLLPGVSRERIEAMQEYQAMMGDIQDVEVLLAALDKYLRKGKISSAVGQRFRDELLRRRQWLIEIYLSQANRLREFWPLSQSASAKATGKKGNKKK